MHIKYNNQKGIGLIEVIAAFAISIVVITSLVALALYTVRSSLNSKLLLEGTRVATREIERVRALRDSSATWQIFLDDVKSGTGVDCTCNASPCAKQCSINVTPVLSVSSGATIETIDNQAVTHYFNVTTDPVDPANIVRISVFVTWNIGSQTKGTNVYTDLTNWQIN